MTALKFRLATKEDLKDIIDMLKDDKLGTARESNTLDKYLPAFDRISNDSNQELTVAVLNGEVVGTFQLTFIQGLSYEGGIRAQVEAVRTHSAYRGQGIGKQMFAYVMERAREKGAHIVQLTTHKSRHDAIRFYENLGFHSTHEGMKLFLD
ncbi:GNAT family N-acetyltransferase [Chitinophaga sp. 212800010-3]|uniref:GNAT family N-acetyltransferase n=1 Tax=unclassified Chitinophaga TaxID=2619133 RepID=UPI002DF40E42|nr:Glucosamine-phosphate N-acetyltransferase [Chitinophaga sp. 212800010-3]